MQRVGVGRDDGSARARLAYAFGRRRWSNEAAGFCGGGGTRGGKFKIAGGGEAGFMKSLYLGFCCRLRPPTFSNSNGD